MPAYTNPGGINAACGNVLPIFFCPSDPVSSVNLGHPGNNYRGNQGTAFM
jgi:hypothetical protein